MKRLLIIASLALSLSSCGALANLDPSLMSSAAGNALTALALSDSDIAVLSAQSIAQLDATNVIDNGSYIQRLQRVMAGIDQVDGINLNFKVYRTQEINAFACGDGSIRVYSGLMDVMDDDELIAIIGHEIGHVVHHDTRNAMKKAYMASAAREVVAAAGGKIGNLAASVVGDLAMNYVNAQFSQKQEYAADQYGFEFAIAHGHSKYSMYNALVELLNLSSGSQASQVEQMFSSHPGTRERALQVREMADALN